MNTTRTGKIARLPRAIREQLNQRLADGRSGPEILKWLHEQKVVWDVLVDHFDGNGISEKNLSEWRQGGYQDWLKLQETRALATRFVEQAQTIAEDVDGPVVNDSLATLLAIEFGKLTQALLSQDMDLKQRWECLGDIQSRLSRCRRDDHYAGTLALKRERWSRHIRAEDSAAAKAADKEERRQHVTRYRILRGGLLDHHSKFFGKGDIAHDVAAMSLEEKHNLEFGLLGRQSDLFAVRKDVDEPIYPWRRDTDEPAAEAPAPKPAAAKPNKRKANAPKATAAPTPETPPSPTVEPELTPATPSTSPNPGRQTPDPTPILLTPDPRSETLITARNPEFSPGDHPGFRAPNPELNVGNCN